MSISAMKKLVVITTGNETDSMIKSLLRLKCVDVRATQSEECGYLLDKMNCDEQRAQCEKNVAKINKILPYMAKNSPRKSKFGLFKTKINREEFIKDGSYANAWEVVEKLDTSLDKIEELRNKILYNQGVISSLEPWLGYGVSNSLVQTQYTNLLLGSLPAGTEISSVQGALGELYAGFEIESEDESAVYVSLICLKADTDKVVSQLGAIGFVKVVIKDVNTTPKKATVKLNSEIEQIHSEIAKIEEEISELPKYISDVETLFDIESTDLVAVINKQKMARTENCAVLVGWVPQVLEEKISSCLGDLNCAYQMSEPLDGEEPPVLLANNKFATNFEWVVGMYSYPKYGSFDPTFIMSIFYFVIFGLMFADVGYGLILVVAGLLLPRKIDLGQGGTRMFNMFGYCGISCMVMGVFFGGWFGDLPYAIMQNFMGIENPASVIPFFNGIWINPINEPMTFLIISLGMGAIHLVAGMLIQFIILCKEGKVFDAIFDIGSWFVIFSGIALIFLAGGLVGGITLGVGVAMIVLTKGRHEKNIVMKFLKGLLGLYDVTSYASDLLSYSRILALGLAAGVIAQVINLIGTMGGPTVMGFVALVLSFLIGHTLNLAINILGSFVHTSRLQYLEFFNKFYVDGGEQFEAAAPSEQYTLD